MRRRDVIVRGALDLPEHVTENDRREIERFADFLRRLHAAESAGVSRVDAADALYPDVYEEAADAPKRP